MNCPIRLALPLFSLCVFAASSAFAEEKVNFSRDVRPILSENCFACHGFDDKARKAKLRLDTPEGAFKKHDDKAPIVPGKPEQSDVVRRILTADADDHM